MFLISCSAIKKTQQKIDKKFSSSIVFEKGFSGFALYDPDSDEMIYSHNTDKYFTPASNTKLFTLYTGLMLLGDSLQGLKYTIQGDSLIFKGTGDPALLNPNLPESRVFDYLNNTNKILLYAPPIYKGKPLGPGWAWDDYDSYYSAEKTDLPMYGNLIELNFTETREPELFPGMFRDSIMKVAPFGPETKYAQRALSSNRMEYQEYDRGSNWTQYIPIRFSKDLIPTLLADTLKKPVSVFRGKTKDLVFDRTLYSIPSDSIYKRMMQVSDNFIAEQIMLMAADKISDTLKTEIAIDYMNEKYLKDLPDEPQWFDGSGLSRYNLFTPRTMVRLIDKIDQAISRDKLFDILPAGGESGTLKDYYAARTPYIYAKTGTLRNNHSLSGFLITKSGRTLIFSFMNSNYTVPTSELKKAMAEILELVRDNY